MSNRVMRNLPPIYHELIEAKALTESVSNELEMIEVAKKRVENEQFIETSSERFIRIREQGYDIRADPSTETLDFRRRRLIARQSSRMPITQRRVHEILRTLVSGGFEEHLDVEKCETLFVFDATEQSISREIDYTLERLIPLNMKLSIARRVKTKVYVPAYMNVGTEITIHPMQIGDIRDQVNLNVAAYAQITREVTINPI
ncbi:putative phage tail protein [Sporosarcina sp. FSL W7-1349]|uniref:putative phage tail protein n=1 Tax=Sporosarcina sp. FSL W7-1349 TaxID=2921561 RepID=UPI0030FAE2A4